MTTLQKGSSRRKWIHIELDNVSDSAVSDVVLDIVNGGGSADPPIKTRPIQIDEFIWNLVSKRPLLINNPELKKTLLEMQQLGASAAGEVDVSAIFHQLVYAAWMAGLLTKPLTRIKVDEKSCLGSFECDLVRHACREFHPKREAVAVGSI